MCPSSESWRTTWATERNRRTLAAAVEQFAGQPPGKEMLETLVRPNPDYLLAGLNAASAGYGSIESYLENAGGLDAGRRERLRNLMID